MSRPLDEPRNFRYIRTIVSARQGLFYDFFISSETTVTLMRRLMHGAEPEIRSATAARALTLLARLRRGDPPTRKIPLRDHNVSNVLATCASSAASNRILSQRDGLVATAFGGFRHGFRPGARAQFSEHGFHMEFHGVQRDVQSAGDGLVGHAFGKRCQHFDLARR